jgi:hypothetical protein
LNPTFEQEVGVGRERPRGEQMKLDPPVKKAEVGLVIQSRGCRTILAIGSILRVQVVERTKVKPLFWLNTRRDAVGKAGFRLEKNQAPRRDIAP